jgi:dipeptidyl aminopeptidase/acylaminoacyl peptidase
LHCVAGIASATVVFSDRFHCTSFFLLTQAQDDAIWIRYGVQFIHNIYKGCVMKKVLFVLLAAFLALPGFAHQPKADQPLAEKRPFTIADFYHIKGVADPQISPDGKKIAFTVTQSFLEEGKTNADIYLMNADGSDIRQLTDNPAADNHPRWSPDGKSLLFLSTRKDGQQAWLLPLEGGEPKQLTNISTEIDNVEWLADGKHFVYTSEVFPEYGANDNDNKKINESMENGPIQAHMADHLMYRHWTEWKDGHRTHTFVYDIETKTSVDVSPGDWDAPAFSLGTSGLAVSPDGKEVSFDSNHDPNEQETTNKDVFVVSSEGGAPKDITEENKAYDGTPQFSPDGKYIAYRTQKIPAYESDLFRLALYNRETGEKTLLTGKENFDNWTDDFKWAPDSKSIYFLGEVEGHVPLYNINIKTKHIEEIIDAKTIDAFDVSPDGKFIVFNRRSINEPVDIWRCTAQGKELRRLTFFNKPVEDSVDIRPAEVIWVNSPTGVKVQTFIVKPHDFDPSKKYPLILNVHGGPQGQWEDAFRGDWQMYPGAGYIIAFPNPHGSTGFGQEYTAEISKDWGGKVYEDVMAVTDSLANLPYVDNTRMGAMGWSYGGYMMMWLEGHTTRFKAIAAMMGVYDLPAMYGATEELWFPQWDLNGKPWTSDLYTKFSPNNFVQNFKTPCLVITGEQDFRVPYTQSLEFFTDLQEMSVPSRLIVFKNDGHWPNGVKSMPLYYNAHLDWFHKYLGGAPAPYDMTKMVRNEAFEKK